ncbi:phospholipase-like protein [Tanacetum coccineum]
MYVSQSFAKHGSSTVTSDSERFLRHLPQIFRPYLTGLQDVRGDGNCGFRSVAVALGLSEDQWPRIRSDLVRELEANHQKYKYIFGTTGYKKIYNTVRFAGKWMEMPNTGLIIASAYNRVVISLANGGNVGGCTTTFPLWSSPPQSEPHETIVIAHVYGNHYIKAALREGCPLPMTHPLWRTYRSDIASRWEDPYEYRARVHVKSKLHYLPMLKDRLGMDRCVLFRETCFGCWLDLTCVEKDESLIHYMLQKQKISDNDHYDLPLIYNVNGHTLHFGRQEFCLISGFKFGFLSFRKFREGDITFRDRVFLHKIGEYVKNIDLLSLIEDEDRFISLSDSDSVRVCLLLALEVIFIGHELGSAVDDVFLRMVEDLDIWNNFPWGEYVWRDLYGAIRNVNLNHKAPPVEYGGLFGSYLKKLSLAKTLREKGGDADPVCQTSAKDVSLKDRVKAMEGLCTSLMILPKEIKSLKARVYKLETIINVITKKQKRSDLKEKDKLNSVDKQCDIGENFWSDEDGELLSFTVSPKQSAKKNAINELVDALDDLVDENVLVEAETDLSQDDGLKNQKLEAENKRLAEQRRLRFHKMKEEENSMKSGLLSNSTHMKLALEKCGTNKRRYVNVLRPPLEEDTWDEEDLNRPFKCIDKVYCNFLLEQFLVTSSWCKFRFPWCNDIIVDRRFWDSLIGLDDKRLGWLLDDHIELWVWYMWHFRQTCHDWSIVSCYFLTLLLQDSMPYFYVTDEIYPISWKDVEQVFIPINEPTRHWSLALFHISSGSVTFYDSQKIYDVEYRPWYLKMRSCLETKLPVILQQYVPKDGGGFGDLSACFYAYFLYIY